MTQRILVTGASGDIGEAVGRILAEMRGVEVHGAEAGDAWPARVTYQTVHHLPLAAAPDYVSRLRELVESIRADIVIPLTEPELSVLSRSSGAALPLLWLGPQIVGTFLDKLSTATWLRDHGFPGPRTTILPEALPTDLPLVVKPRIGSGGRGVRVVKDPWELEGLQRSHADPETWVAQELLLPDDGEVTCAVIRIGGTIRTLQLRRSLMGGLTSRATVVFDADVERLLVAMAEALAVEGCLNVQLRMTSDGPKIFEVNPRISSTVGMRQRIGFRDLEWWLKAPEEGPPPEFDATVGTRIFRLSNEVVVTP